VLPSPFSPLPPGRPPLLFPPLLLSGKKHGPIPFPPFYFTVIARTSMLLFSVFFESNFFSLSPLSFPLPLLKRKKNTSFHQCNGQELPFRPFLPSFFKALEIRAGPVLMEFKVASWLLSRPWISLVPPLSSLTYTRRSPPLSGRTKFNSKPPFPPFLTFFSLFSPSFFFPGSSGFPPFFPPPLEVYLSWGVTWGPSLFSIFCLKTFSPPPPPPPLFFPERGFDFWRPFLQLKTESEY